MVKETDLLKDPVSVAQLRYREQISAFKAQYLPDPKKEVKILLTSMVIDLMLYEVNNDPGRKKKSEQTHNFII